ncbi:MAG: dephospho-CoA kinase [Chloroflexi bacterium]|nr:dephospho-CoA kinase [Chloroflexota bacterium]
MSNWPGKYVIGLTGNIATGKSVVRRMLEHLGAYSIDADALSHRAISKGAPGFAPVVEAFGKFILDASGEIDRAKLGRIVFSDPEALKALETIVHPLVEHAVDMMIQRANQRVVVIEAIKLLEGKLSSACDTVWVAYAPEAIQKARLVQKRGLSETEALQRIHAQPPQEVKTAAANVVIQNTGSFEDTWKQVVAAWKVISPITDTMPVVMKKAAPGELAVQRGRPRDSASIAALVTRLSDGSRSPSHEDIMAEFGEKAFLLLTADKQLVGLAGWQVENLVARTTDLYLDPNIPLHQALKTLITELERASQDLQCEASLVFLPQQAASQEGIWKELGYSRRTPHTLGAQAWQDAASESQPPSTILLFKQLRQDRVLRPI